MAFSSSANLSSTELWREGQALVEEPDVAPWLMHIIWVGEVGISLAVRLGRAAVHQKMPSEIPGGTQEFWGE